MTLRRPSACRRGGGKQFVVSGLLSQLHVAADRTHAFGGAAVGVIERAVARVDGGRRLRRRGAADGLAVKVDAVGVLVVRVLLERLATAVERARAIVASVIGAAQQQSHQETSLEGVVLSSKGSAHKYEALMVVFLRPGMVKRLGDGGPGGCWLVSEGLEAGGGHAKERGLEEAGYAGEGRGGEAR